MCARMSSSRRANEIGITRFPFSSFWLYKKMILKKYLYLYIGPCGFMGDDILIYLSVLDEQRERKVSALKLPDASRAFTARDFDLCRDFIVF